MSNNLIIIKKTDLDPILELYRGKTYCNIINYFIYIVTKNLGKNIFNLKKSYQRTLTNILSSWMFNLYVFTSSHITSDPFLPKNCININILKITLLDFCKNDTDIKDVELIIDTLLNEFTIYYNSQYDNLINYSKSIFYINEKNNYKIIKKKIIQKRDNQNIDFYKFTIIINFAITNEKLENILNNILVPIDVYNKMCTNYSGNIKVIDHYIWSIVFRYQLLGSNNHQLGI